MVTATTHGVKVTVETEYQEGYSSPKQRHFVFTYRVTIENHGDYAVQLMRRHWLIYDSDGSVKEVEGEGVVGQQPVIEPGQSHQYVSGCNLQTGFGKMQGTYLMQRLSDDRAFDVEIPEFVMIVPYMLN